MVKKIKKLLAAEIVFFRKSLAGIFLFLTVLFFLSALAGFFFSLKNPDIAARIFESVRASYESKGLFDVSSNFSLFLLIFYNNIVAALLSLAAGIIPFLFLSAIPVAVNGFSLGLIVAVVFGEGKGILMTVISLLPHGIVELPIFFYAASLGIYLALGISKKIAGRPISLKEVFKDVSRSFVLIVFPLLLLAAFIEAFVTYAIVKN
jgi:stage II sporulation protein M